ncbi:MAG: molybdopterin molybdotransferase MoeA [Candidatus Limnocylindria bacterium]
MLSLEEARDRLLAGIRLTDPERLTLHQAAGRVPAASSVTAAHDVPGFDNSAMDGYAVRAADCPGRLRVLGESRAGAGTSPEVESGTAIRIMTGAPMPAGADAVVPVEAAEEVDGVVHVAAAPEVGAHVRVAGHDVAAGTLVELPAEPMTAATIGLLAALGVGEVEVRRRPRVAILSTGDELVPPGGRLEPGQIHDANGVALAAAVAEAGGEVEMLGCAADRPDAIEASLRQGADAADLIVASGGVSVGRHDHVRGAIERLGSIDFWRIAVQPGKPLAAGRIEDVPVVGLPGNPVSALVTFELLVRLMLRSMLGLAGDGRLHVRARVDERIGKDPGRRAFLRVRLRPDGEGYCAESAGGQASSQLLPLATSNALLVVPEGLEATEPGASYEAIVTGQPS